LIPPIRQRMLVNKFPACATLRWIMTKRAILAACSFLVVFACTPLLAVDSVKLRVSETAGIRRFGYPVHAVVPLPRPPVEGEHLQLAHEGKPLAAQFTLRGKDAVEIDFAVSLGPNESRDLEIRYAKGEAAATKGMRVEAEADRFRVQHAGGLEFAVPKDLRGLLAGVKTNRTEYLRPDSPGLLLHTRDGRKLRLGGSEFKATVTKSGPIACGLRFEGTLLVAEDEPAKSFIEMDFPQSKSWVRVRCTIWDPKLAVQAVAAELNLSLAGEPTLVDFGVGTSAYAALRQGQSATLAARGPDAKNEDAPAWSIHVGPPAKKSPYVLAPRGVRPGPGEGWLHVMDRERCTAVAVEEFARSGTDNVLSVAADGRLELARTFGKSGPARKTFAFYLHFVGMPVHVGAQTSPQSMLAPLQVKVEQ
jgi:hypothetical protein